MLNRFIVIDLETTGNNPDKDKIIQVGAILIENGKISKEYSSFVYTDITIPPYIQQLTGIEKEMLVDAPPIEKVLADILPLMEGSTFVAHHAAFDYAFIQSALEDAGYLPFSGLVMDTLDFSRILMPMAQSYKLTQITEELEINLDQPHRADEDARATAELFIQLNEQLNKMPLLYLQRLFEFIRHTHQDLSVLVENVMTAKLSSYQEEEEEQEYTFVNQMALQRMEEYEEEEAENDPENSDFESMFEEEGLLFHQFPDFELRPAQKTMAENVWNSFSEQSHLMVEAGTGTGKSLAYLIPSIYWSKENDEKVVIATHTINLQEQLYQRDIPLLKEILPFGFRATILKGRNNYLCLRKFEQLVLNYSTVDTNKEYAVDMSQLMTWVAQTKTGDAEELNLSPSGRNLWNQVRSDADSCLNRYCPWFRSCFYHRARNKAQDADLIITNHSLLLTNLKADHRILPSFDRLVIDEAHQFEDVASKHLGTELNQYQFQALLQRLYKDSKNGFLVNMSNALIASQDPDQAVAANHIQNHVLPSISRVETNMFNYFNILGDYVASKVRNNDLGRNSLRITDKVKSTEGWNGVVDAGENVFIELTELTNQMDEVAMKLRNLEVEESLMADYNGHLKDLKDVMFIFSEWNNANDKNMVFWAETTARGKRYASYLYSSPIEIGPYIKQYLFDKLDSIILTSATLSVNGSFDYSSRIFGFDPADENLTKMTLPSPFDFKKQAVVCIPKDVPNIQAVSESEFIQYIANHIIDIAISFNGKTMVLFTSHSMLQKTYQILKAGLEPLSFKVLGHGIDSNSRTKLTQQFATSEQTVLLGTNSFWEGVDIPGEALSALVMVKLPFTPPNHPIHEAKTEIMKQKGMNSFMQLSVPQAVIRFKQGFGRLIRTKKDKGIVVIFDKRIAESRYGKAFIYSLPKVNILYKPFDTMMEIIEKWK